MHERKVLTQKKKQFLTEKEKDSINLVKNPFPGKYSPFHAPKIENRLLQEVRHFLHRFSEERTFLHEISQV